ncbi:MAG: adenosylmethionine--8-amino-7-oxononanoate transaminase [Nitriliruptorales bacterium]|nr:adenosylmethionine--8-amino-7-oxononanoate transaminase [Nitriliruptorales bacterium]
MDDRTARVVRADHEVVWHPFTQQRQWLETTPLVIDSGAGCWLTTTDGRRLLDGNSSLWVNVWGHDRPEIVEAIRTQAERLPHATFLGLTNEPAVAVAKQLIELAPGDLSRVFFSENGAAAVEVAIKMAYAYWQHRGESDRTTFVCLDNAYHGDTLGAVSVGGIDTFHELYGPLLFETLRVPSPYCYRCPLALEYPSCELACADALDDVLAEQGDRVAAVITEPLVQGAAGIITAPDGHLRRLREICDRHGVLLIVDEIATGFGRTGAIFASDLEGVAPDLMCVGKGLTGGYLPMSATLTTEQIHDAFLGDPTDGRTLYHGHSYSGNPLAAAAALANLKLVDSEDLAALSARKAAVLADALGAFESVRHAGDVRQRGLMCGVELVADPDTRTPFDPALTVGKQVCDALVDDGIILRPLGDVLVLMPAPAMADDDIRHLVESTAKAADRVTRALATS